jgi:hypothetical protein
MTQDPKQITPSEPEPRHPLAFLAGVDRSHCFTTEQVMAAIGDSNTDYARGSIERHLHQLNSGERYTLYRAIKKLVLASTPPTVSAAQDSVLPELDVTDIEKSQGRTTAMNTQYFYSKVEKLAADLLCRERQLLAALSELSSLRSLKTCGMVELMLANPNVDSFVRQKEAELASLRSKRGEEIARLREALLKIDEYTIDWQANRIARAALAASPEAESAITEAVCQKCGQDIVLVKGSIWLRAGDRKHTHVPAEAESKSGYREGEEK